MMRAAGRETSARGSSVSELMGAQGAEAASAEKTWPSTLGDLAAGTQPTARGQAELAGRPCAAKLNWQQVQRQKGDREAARGAALLDRRKELADIHSRGYNIISQQTLDNAQGREIREKEGRHREPQPSGCEPSSGQRRTAYNILTGEADALDKLVKAAS